MIVRFIMVKNIPTPWVLSASFGWFWERKVFQQLVRKNVQ